MADFDEDDFVTDEPDDTPDDVRQRQRENQRIMAEHWGPDFASMMVQGYAFCPSQDGAFTGIEFIKPDGSAIRVSMPSVWFLQFFDELKLALVTAAERLNELDTESTVPGETEPARH